MAAKGDPLEAFHEPTRAWFRASFDAPTAVQRAGWGALTAGRSALLFAPTGSGKTLAAFLAAIDRLSFSPTPEAARRCRVLYVSPLKALAVDVERNLREPLVGIAAAAARAGVAYHAVTVDVRTGDTPAAERVRMAKRPADVLVTTPESLYLLLTSAARSTLTSVETVIVDEIHALVPTKRGAHLALSLERLERLAGRRAPLQRVGLSATQRPLDEVARALGGFEGGRARPVEIIDAGRGRRLEVTVEMPADARERPDEGLVPSGPAAIGPGRRSVWPSIYPRLVELIRAHRTTMIFVNSRRLAERLAAAVNEAAGEELAACHHGSIARDTRLLIEDRLKRGELPAIVATSSLELGIDMGAIDLVVLVEAPPSVAAGLQRVGRAGHQVGATSRGVVVPKHRGDLLAATAAVARMRTGEVESTYYPRNPLDVLAQQLIAAVTCESEPVPVDALFDLVRGAAPFAELPRVSFDGVLDMASGRYPSDDFAQLRPRLAWDRLRGLVRARAGSKSLAVVSGGTIPDRGLFGVFLPAGEGETGRRVGELDEEMVFESRPGDVFLLGSSSWRIDEITHDRVVVVPAPGEVGKMPFWHGDRPGRPVDFGAAVGALCRELSAMPPDRGRERLRADYGLDAHAASTLYDYVAEQREATGEVPSDKVIVVERSVDEMGDLRVCVLSPFGTRVHAPWATAVAARLEAERGVPVDCLWADDGMVFRIADGASLPEASAFFPSPDEVRDVVVDALGRTSLFAARFRECAGRALLLPRKMPGRRTPLWAQRKKASDLLAVASRYPSFPIVLETYRECLQDVFDLPALTELLRKVATRELRVAVADTPRPSPFASSLLFSYVAEFLYEGDAPPAERRAQALRIDHAQLRALLGEAELRGLLDADAIEAFERHLQHLDDSRAADSPDALHDLLRTLGDLGEDELVARSARGAPVGAWVDELERDRRACRVRVAGAPRLIAAEDAARFRDALGVVLPRGLPEAFLAPVLDATGDVVGRYARTHGPFVARDAADRLGLGVAVVETALRELESRGRVEQGHFLPQGAGQEWCDREVLRALRRRSLAELRREIEPVEQHVFAAFLPRWQGVGRDRRRGDALASVVEQLQGAPLLASTLENETLPARIERFSPVDLDALCLGGDVVWGGIEAVGPHDGRIALYLADDEAALARPVSPAEGELAGRVRAALAGRGALFFHEIVRAVGGFPTELADALWSLVWSGEVTNDTLAPLRSYLRAGDADHRRAAARRARPGHVPATEGRWSLRSSRRERAPTGAERAAATARALLERYGVVTREAVRAEGVPGGYSVVYPVLKGLEERGHVRRGYFLAGCGAAQFALAGADESMRAMRDDPSRAPTILGATDPANPYGASLPWPNRDEGARPARVAGASVILLGGALIAYLGRDEHSLLTFVPEGEPARSDALQALVEALRERTRQSSRAGLLLATIDGVDAGRGALADALRAAGFVSTSQGLLLRPADPRAPAAHERGVGRFASEIADAPGPSPADEGAEPLAFRRGPPHDQRRAGGRHARG